jgi:pimeloyl-ACP methyl ester carboxylesterase
VDVIGLLVVGAVLVLGVPAAAYFAQDSLLFLPHLAAAPPPATRAPRPVEELEFTTADGVQLRGWFVRGGANPAPLVVYHGGNAENVAWQALEPWPEEWSLALVNYRGYGASEGKPSERALLDDAELVFDALARRPDVDASRIVLVGRSLGSGVATDLAAKKPVRGVILVSPYDSMVAIGRRHYPFLPVGLLLKHPFDSVSRAGSAGAPLLVIVGGRDTIIPPDHSRRLYEAWRGSKQWVEIPSADHNDLGVQPEFWAPIREALAAAGSR